MTSTVGPASASMFVKISAILVAVTGVAQAVMGIMMSADVEAIRSTHKMIGMATLVVAATATAAAWRSYRGTGNRVLLMHAVGTALLALVQVALGELGVETMHITLGVAYTVGAVTLPVMAYRRQAS